MQGTATTRRGSGAILRRVGTSSGRKGLLIPARELLEQLSAEARLEEAVGSAAGGALRSRARKSSPHAPVSTSLIAISSQTGVRVPGVLTAVVLEPKPHPRVLPAVV